MPFSSKLMHRSRHSEGVRVLRETNSLEEARLVVADLPFLTESIRIVNDSFTATGNHATHCKITHEANTLEKMLTLALLNQD
jgi:hypothetical protein